MPRTTADDGRTRLLLSSPRRDGTHSGTEFWRALRRGDVLKLRRGVYVPTVDWLGARPTARHLTATTAVALQRDKPVFCRETALHLHGLPLLTLPSHVHVRAASRSRARVTPQPPMTGPLTQQQFLAAARTRGGLPDSWSSAALRGFSTRGLQPPIPELDAVTRVALPSATTVVAPDGAAPPESLCVESLPLAVADTVARMPFAEAVVVLDAARRGDDQRPPLDPSEVFEAAATLPTSARRRHRLDRLLRFSTPAAESPGESLSRARFDELGFAAPRLQVTLTVGGRLIRVDFLWDDVDVVGEFDGWAKYRRDGRFSHGTLRAEKVREDDIRSTGRRVVRWYWEDLTDPPALCEKLLRAGVPRVSR